MLSRPVVRSRLLAVLSFLLEQWFVIMIGVVITLAYFFPNVVRTPRRPQMPPSADMSIVSLLSRALSWYSPTLPFHAFQAREGGIIKAQFTIKYLAVAVIFFISGLSLPLINLVRSRVPIPPAWELTDTSLLIVQARARVEAASRGAPDQLPAVPSGGVCCTSDQPIPPICS